MVASKGSAGDLVIRKSIKKGVISAFRKIFKKYLFLCFFCQKTKN
jgi:hypothetical protein